MNAGRPNRKALRLPSYDYTSAGAYFVTICCHGRQPFFDVPGMRDVVNRAWHAIPEHFGRARLDEFVVMPNRVHGIVWLVDGPTYNDPRAVGAQHAEPLRPGLRPGSISAVVRSFKGAVTMEARRSGILGDEPLWQRNFHERVVRNDDELNRIRQYVRLNPARWLLDAENPDRRVDSAYDREWGWIDAQPVRSVAVRPL